VFGSIPLSCNEKGESSSFLNQPRTRSHTRFTLFRLDSSKLESALSLQPTAEQRAFEGRKDYDLVVIYDTAAKAFPPKDAAATAPSTLFSLIFEKEFRKILPRSPVLLVGGFEGWEQEQQVRRRSTIGSTSQTNGYTQVAKGTPPVLPSVSQTSYPNTLVSTTEAVSFYLNRVKKTSLPSSGSSLPIPGSPDFGRSARRETGVYRSAAYSRDITENVSWCQSPSKAANTDYRRRLVRWRISSIDGWI